MGYFYIYANKISIHQPPYLISQFWGWLKSRGKKKTIIKIKIRTIDVSDYAFLPY